MTITTVDFNTGSDIALNAYPSGSPQWSYNSTGGGATVYSGSNLVQANGFGGGPTRAYYTGPGTTTGDQDVKITVLVKNFNDAGVIARAAAGTDTCYCALIDTTQTNEVALYRIVSGSATLLNSWDDSLSPGTHTIRLRATGSGASISLEVQTNSNTVHTYSDTDAARLTSGYPGIHISTDEAYTQADTFVIDTLSDSVAPSLTAGPTASSITSAGFTISGTPDEAGTAYLIVTAIGAAQPSNATFDASTETASMTASTNFNIVHTGQ